MSPDPTHKSWDEQVEAMKAHAKAHGYTLEIVRREPKLKDKAAPEELPEKEASRV